MRIQERADGREAAQTGGQAAQTEDAAAAAIPTRAVRADDHPAAGAHRERNADGAEGTDAA